MEVWFVSGNKHKIAEAEAILSSVGIRVIASPLKIEELQTADTEKLVRDKVLKAFRRLGRPLFVEHTGLYIDYINGLPGGLTQIFWDKMEADKFAEVFGKLAPVRAVTAKTTIAYCDGLRIHTFHGEIAGEIVPVPSGSRDFQWDCVFRPAGYTQTFAEMREQKNEISMRRLALDSLAKHLKELSLQ